MAFASLRKTGVFALAALMAGGALVREAEGQTANSITPVGRTTTSATFNTKAPAPAVPSAEALKNVHEYGSFMEALHAARRFLRPVEGQVKAEGIAIFIAKAPRDGVLKSDGTVLTKDYIVNRMLERMETVHPGVKYRILLMPSQTIRDHVGIMIDGNELDKAIGTDPTFAALDRNVARFKSGNNPSATVTASQGVAGTELPRPQQN